MRRVQARSCWELFLPRESPLWSREVPERQECEPGLQWRKGKNRTVNIRAEPCCQEMTYRSGERAVSGRAAFVIKLRLEPAACDLSIFRRSVGGAINAV